MVYIGIVGYHNLSIVGVYLKVLSLMSLVQLTWRNLHALDKGFVEAKKEAWIDIPGKMGISLWTYLLPKSTVTIQKYKIKYNKCLL